MDSLDSLDDAQREMLSQFQAITNTEDLDTAVVLLNSTSWDLEVRPRSFASTNDRDRIGTDRAKAAGPRKRNVGGPPSTQRREDIHPDERGPESSLGGHTGATLVGLRAEREIHLAHPTCPLARARHARAEDTAITRIGQNPS